MKQWAGFILLNGKIEAKEVKTKDFTKMDRKELTTLLVDDQIKRNIIKPESRERQIKLRMTGSAKMSKTELINYAEKYLK